MLKIESRISSLDSVFRDLLERKDFLSALLEQGIDLTLESSDLKLVSQGNWGNGLFPANTKLILLEGRDEGFIFDFRSTIKREDVLGLLKGSLYKPEYHNHLYSCGRLQSEFLRDQLSLDLEGKTNKFYPTLFPSDINKLKLFCGFASAPHLSKWVETPLDPTIGRPIKVNFSLNFTYNGDPLLEFHRDLARKNLQTWCLQDKASVLYGASKADERAFSPGEYQYFMQHSKVVVSPWGWGEFCHRDFEALLAGCVLVKPETSFSETWPPLEPGVHYVPCKMDFSDLPEKINLAMSPEWFNNSRRLSLRDHVLQAWNMNLVATRFSKIVKDLL